MTYGQCITYGSKPLHLKVLDQIRKLRGGWILIHHRVALPRATEEEC